MNFEGIYTALVTPFGENETGIDEKAYRKLIERQIQAGIKGIVVAGSTGEGQTLTEAEWETALKIAITYKDQIQILGSCGTSNTAETISRFKKLASLGADAALISTPGYNKPPQRGLIEHYQKVAASAALPIMVYNIPGRTAVNLTPATIRELWKISNVASIKESSGNWDQILEIRKDLPENKFLLSGDDPFNLPFFSIGAHGAVSVLSNIAPKALVQMLAAFKKSDLKTAEKIQMQVHKLTQLLFVESNPIPVKWLVGQILKQNLSPRLPLVKLDETHHSALKREFDRLVELQLV
ncbi:MAG: 4-hydroxy-tetrahydrodipicolinate synthase [Deltaproteobacteria bacterium]|nr:4-hydroxy-tetrahydrodipicolinate synthase [Deltaproteobacteria bacterium]